MCGCREVTSSEGDDLILTLWKHSGNDHCLHATVDMAVKAVRMLCEQTIFTVRTYYCWKFASITHTHMHTRAHTLVHTHTYTHTHT